MLRAENLGKSYGAERVLDSVSFALAGEETLAVVGPSGCGKTSLLYILSGLVRPDSGAVLLDGAPISGPTPDISIILQDYGLLPWRTVEDNVALGLKVQGVPRAERRARAKAQLAELGIVGRGQDFPATLSGGEQQRVAIARAFVSRPRLMLLDEPFSSLDALTRERLQRTLLDVWKRRRVPYVLVTHSLEEAVVLGRRIMVMSGRPARPVAVFDNPGFGDASIRDTEACFKLLKELRHTVEDVW
ncbi:MAG: ABC transporter ATP-binding protein [Pseudodesulfovibrio sp.]|uniref:ABC transporter related protein n=1 Tax=Pseudodesulfovibrio aespoeensis (strain ATCC 700646 / DSM 10631 / Aspo-2) TaxID=643562 RepID=E6VUM0_PSEA9|nr:MULTISPECIES: ABC transporter ATP-binding protein [Pseudodesulfovibrio]MBU4243311.1 ABC transporter ATP-binding protein [Pseudomonadota bacterium]ADU62261.1 ABC transporter related protein [Pseudodesulfovibrio aespoeensis Aspo-2]MBU4380477.1 ABC transporter ATP-binding protein [Pseudomonadota bacterium]MBU4476623.1 ABC transporter ATP-binding protein [Pseudomonadota bacterium]MBU4515272.1 ABC transporter ATP-binding protein [Pseudomonadota bacterium]